MTESFKVIVKVGNDKFLKYNVHSFIKFTLFLDKNYPDWRYYNVFDKKTGHQVANFTRNNRPKTEKLSRKH